MSAFICSDKHIATIAYNVGSFIELDQDGIQAFANKLKQINIASVNYRYSEKTAKRKCNIEDYITISNRHDLAGLISCWIYQSCEDGANVDFIAYKIMLEFFISTNKLDLDLSTAWSI